MAHSPVRSDTARQRLRRLLSTEPATARELSQKAGLSEKDVLAHLPYLARSLDREGVSLVMIPARCMRCGFTFEARPDRARPSRCPECKGERVLAARFGL